ncbi:MOSC domain-containing protein [Oceanobacillus halophilus]|uniref:MOSC domain-containing protein n=1 Tax=Oceanobacillus halophilus TaxID=930130 RepID=A0A495A274_9BACI|nr:MOSC domain-containing protein [Oceanobacillus halophilus]RKQ33565.1 MOSC domain-containing protein [Oceanobacillus halophilus]
MGEREIKYFAVGKPKKMTYGNGKEMNTGIKKEEVEVAFLARDGFFGDGVADLKNHGGLDRAVCIYPYEHYSMWENEFNTSLDCAAFGENLTVTNMLEHDIHIGDTFQLGNAVIQVTQGRIPCSTINKRTNIPTLLKRLVETGYTGYLCRVLEEGKVRKNSKLELLTSPKKKICVHDATMTLLHRHDDLDAMNRLLKVPELADEWQKKLRKRIEKTSTC